MRRFSLMLIVFVLLAFVPVQSTFAQRSVSPVCHGPVQFGPTVTTNVHNTSFNYVQWLYSDAYGNSYAHTVTVISTDGKSSYSHLRKVRIVRMPQVGDQLCSLTTNEYHYISTDEESLRPFSSG